MRAVRFGSYSMCATLAGTPSLSTRLKSIRRYWRLWPPPWCRVVIRPWALRPPFLGSGAQQRLLRRRPGDLGEVGDAGAATARRRRLVLTDSHCLHPSADRAAEGLDRSPSASFTIARLVSLRLPEAGPGALALALAVERVDRQDADVEDLLDRDLDLGLVRVRVDQERVPVPVRARCSSSPRRPARR